MTTPHPKRRYFRYRLRTLMIVVTVFCIWMGITAKRARDQRQTVESILEAGGKITYKHETPYSPIDPPRPEWLRKLIGDDYFFSVAEVDYTGPEFNDSNVTVIKRLTNLKALSLFQTKVTDAGLLHLKELTSLQALNLRYTQITDAGLKHLKGLTNLGGLFLDHTQITDTGLVHLKGLTQLRSLTLRNTQVTDEGVKKLQQALPNCKISH